MVSLPLAFMMPDPCAKNRLKHYEGINSDANAMMRICKASLRTNGEPSKYQNNRSEDDRYYLKPDVYPEREYSISMVEACDHNRCGNDEEEGNSCHNAVASNNVVVLREAREPIAHAIVLHDVERESHKIGEEEVISSAVPCTIADVITDCI